MGTMRESLIIRIKERSGIQRTVEPVSISVPFPPGDLFEPGAIFLSDEADIPLPCGTKPLAAWPDNSVRWLLVDTQVSMKGAEKFAWH